MEKTPARIEQTAWQKRIRCEEVAEKSKCGIGEKHDGSYDRERKLEADGEELVGFPAKDQGRRGSEAVKRENFSFHQKSGEQNAAHHSRAQARDVESGNSGVKKQRRDDETDRPFSRQSSQRGQNPEKSRDDSHVQSCDGEQMEGAGLLKWFFDVFRRLMPQTESHPADRSRHFGRIFQIARQDTLHPSA